MKFVLLLCACVVVSSALELPSLKLLLEQKHQLRTNQGEQSSLKKRSEPQLGKRLWIGSVVHSIEHAAQNVGHAVETAVHDAGHALGGLLEGAKDVVGEAKNAFQNVLKDIERTVQDLGHQLSDLLSSVPNVCNYLVHNGSTVVPTDVTVPPELERTLQVVLQAFQKALPTTETLKHLTEEACRDVLHSIIGK
ncbi:uncharacterized protein LOC112577441 [Pomacea canaliculata]|nr:uncharacterized protein LOC112577441 [Pomacea canaliculata]